MLHKKISSTQNPRIKNIIKLQKASERKRQHLFVIEGAKEIGLALQAQQEITELYVCPKLFNEESRRLLTQQNNIPLLEITENIYQKIAYRDSHDGIIAIARMYEKNINNIYLSITPLVIVLESVEKPGNLGAIIRTADAAGADAVIICDPQTDIFNPNVIRSSIGCLFTTNVVTCTNQQAYEWLKKNNITSYAAVVGVTTCYYEETYRESTAFIMGTESSGLSPFWIKNADKKISIPMAGRIDSLNVSTATAIMVFEAKRQREKNNPKLHNSKTLPDNNQGLPGR